MFHNFEIFLKTEIFNAALGSSKGWSFSMIENWWLLIAAAILGLAKHIYESVADEKLNSKRLDWLEKNFPEYYEENKKYAVGIDD